MSCLFCYWHQVVSYTFGPPSPRHNHFLPLPGLDFQLLIWLILPHFRSPLMLLLVAPGYSFHYLPSLQLPHMVSFASTRLPATHSAIFSLLFQLQDLHSGQLSLSILRLLGNVPGLGAKVDPSWSLPHTAAIIPLCLSHLVVTTYPCHM